VAVGPATTHDKLIGAIERKPPSHPLAAGVITDLEMTLHPRLRAGARGRCET
jgi:hypothetical protein